MNTQMITQNQASELALMGTEPTMSSREIAELTGKQHQHVKRDIENMLSELNKDASNFGHIYLDSMNRRQTEYLLGRMHVECLLMGYSAPLRMTVLRHLKELEMRANLGFDPNNRVEVFEHLLFQAKKNEALKIELEEAKPAVQFVEKYVDGSGLMGFRQVCKTLKVKENTFREFLLEKKIMYRLNGQLTAYSHHIDADRFTVKTGINGHNGHAFADTMFTPKGVNWIAGEWAKHQIQGEL